MQVPRILGPVVLVVDQLPQLARDSKLGAYISSMWGSVDGCRNAILADFFRHAFDGAGADNFFDVRICPNANQSIVIPMNIQREKHNKHHQS